MRPHVAFAVAQADREGITAPTSQLMNRLGVLLHAKALSAEAEPLMRRALAIDESSFGADHPEVAGDLNNLAQLLKDTNRLAEAEPLMRRAVIAILNFTRKTGHEHPHLSQVLGNYAGLLAEMGLPEEEVQARLNSLL